MITLPGTPQAQPRPKNQIRFSEGTHQVVVASVKFIAKVQKLVIEYQSEDGQFFVEDWLGFSSDAQSKRTFSYTCRLHELAGIDTPKGGAFEESALIGTVCQITLVRAGEYLNFADFPCAVSDPDGF